MLQASWRFHGTDTCQLAVTLGILTSQHRCRGCVCCLKLSPNLRKALKPSAEAKQKADILEVRWGLHALHSQFCCLSVLSSLGSVLLLQDTCAPVCRLPSWIKSSQ